MRSLYEAISILECHNPEHPCMVYLPTSTIKKPRFTYMYMDPMGKGLVHIAQGFSPSTSR